MWTVPAVTSSSPAASAERGRLPGAGRPDEGEQLAVGDLEIEAPQRLDLSVRLWTPAYASPATPYLSARANMSCVRSFSRRTISSLGTFS